MLLAAPALAQDWDSHSLKFSGVVAMFPQGATVKEIETVVEPGARMIVGVPPNAEPAPRLTVAVSRMPSSTLKAFSGQMPEAAALYSIRACNATSKPQELDPGQVEMAIVASGIAIVPRELARPTVERSQSRAAGLWRVLGIAAPAVAGAVLGFGASGGLKLNGWQAAGLSVIGSGLKLVGDADSAARAQERRQFDDAGPWLSDMPAVLLEPGRCYPAVRALGSFDRERRAFIVEVQ
jgi:hypothetical protein